MGDHKAPRLPPSESRDPAVRRQVKPEPPAAPPRKFVSGEPIVGRFACTESNLKPPSAGRLTGLYVNHVRIDIEPVDVQKGDRLAIVSSDGRYRFDVRPPKPESRWQRIRRWWAR